MMNGKRWILEVITLNGVSFGNAFWTTLFGDLSIAQVVLILLTGFYTVLKIYAFFKKRKKVKGK